MAAKEKVLVYECISGGGLAASEAADDAELLAQGVAMRDALVADLARLDHVSVSCVAAPGAPLPSALARVRVIAAEASARPEDFLACQARRHDRVWVIAPESGGLLAAFAAAAGDGRWLGCSRNAIRLASSKAATRQHLAGCGIRVPAAWHPGDPEPAAGGAWVVKPDDGAGSVDTLLHRDFLPARDDLLGRRARGLACTAESWVEGIPLSLSLLCADGQAELLSINHQRIVARPGEPVAYRGVDIQAEPVNSPAGHLLARLAERIASAIPGLAGYVGVDLVWHAADGPVVIEINPRLTCAYVGLSAALGRNLAGEILLALHPQASSHGLLH